VLCLVISHSHFVSCNKCISKSTHNFLSFSPFGEFGSLLFTYLLYHTRKEKSILFEKIFILEIVVDPTTMYLGHGCIDRATCIITSYKDCEVLRAER
jgi:hypothetical protein